MNVSYYFPKAFADMNTEQVSLYICKAEADKKQTSRYHITKSCIVNLCNRDV